MPEPTLHILPTAEAVARAAATLIADEAQAALAARGRFTLALSGGSTPRAAYEILAHTALAWEHAHFFWGDERAVPPDHTDSCYRMAREALLAHAPIPAANIHRIEGERAPEEAAQRYEQHLRNFFDEAPPRFDLILLGLGDDGHTASIFPGSSAVRETARWVVAQAHTTPPLPLVSRVTFAPPLLNAAAHCVFLVTGANKAARVHDVLRGPYQPEVWPAQLIRPTAGRVTWVLDEGAARDLLR